MRPAERLRTDIRGGSARNADRLLREGGGDRAADDQLDHLLVIDGLDREAADIAAVAQHGEIVAEGAHFRQAMGDEEDRDPFALQPLDQPAEPIDVPAREGGGRLVEQQDAGLAEDGARDLDLLAQGQIEAADLAEGLDPGDAQILQQGRDLLGAVAPAQQAEAVDGLIGQQDVLGHREIGDLGQLLKGGLDPGAMGIAGTVEMQLLAEGGERPGIGAHEAAEQLHHGGLAGAVLAQQSVDLAGGDLEARPVERHRRAEDLAHAGG